MELKKLKEIIKQTVREAFKEELKDLLLEAIKSNQLVVQSPVSQPRQQVVENQGTNNFDLRDAYQSLLSGNTPITTQALNNHTPQYIAKPVNTAAEGSSLPPGEVGLDQILGLMSSR